MVQMLLVYWVADAWVIRASKIIFAIPDTFSKGSLLLRFPPALAHQFWGDGSTSARLLIDLLVAGFPRPILVGFVENLEYTVAPPRLFSGTEGHQGILQEPPKTFS